MKNIRQEFGIWIQLLTFVCIWVGMLYFSESGLVINRGAFKKLPDAITIYLILHFIFTKWGWKIPILQGWLVPFPNLQGTWKGMLQTTWIDPKTEQVPPPIPIIMVIRQTFSSISLTMYTKESNSRSSAAQLIEIENSQGKEIRFTYHNVPKATIRDRSAIHEGAATLRIISDKEMKLQGEYWTNRKSTGEMSLSFHTEQLLEAFPEESTVQI